MDIHCYRGRTVFFSPRLPSPALVNLIKWIAYFCEKVFKIEPTTALNTASITFYVTENVVFPKPLLYPSYFLFLLGFSSFLLTSQSTQHFHPHEHIMKHVRRVVSLQNAFSIAVLLIT